MPARMELSAVRSSSTGKYLMTLAPVVRLSIWTPKRTTEIVSIPALLLVTE
jgi:hypothetical protein